MPSEPYFTPVRIDSDAALTGRRTIRVLTQDFAGISSACEALPRYNAHKIRCEGGPVGVPKVVWMGVAL